MSSLLSVLVIIVNGPVGLADKQDHYLYVKGMLANFVYDF